jgi:hypothetical protein
VWYLGLIGLAHHNGLSGPALDLEMHKRAVSCPDLLTSSPHAPRFGSIPSTPPSPSPSLSLLTTASRGSLFRDLSDAGTPTLILFLVAYLHIKNISTPPFTSRPLERQARILRGLQRDNSCIHPTAAWSDVPTSMLRFVSYIRDAGIR